MHRSTSHQGVSSKYSAELSVLDLSAPCGSQESSICCKARRPIVRESAVRSHRWGESFPNCRGPECSITLKSKHCGYQDTSMSGRVPWDCGSISHWGRLPGIELLVQRCQWLKSYLATDREAQGLLEKWLQGYTFCSSPR